jgi:hypothetical protein
MVSVAIWRDSAYEAGTLSAVRKTSTAPASSSVLRKRTRVADRGLGKGPVIDDHE